MTFEQERTEVVEEHEQIQLDTESNGPFIIDVELESIADKRRSLRHEEFPYECSGATERLGEDVGDLEENQIDAGNEEVVLEGLSTDIDDDAIEAHSLPAQRIHHDVPSMGDLERDINQWRGAAANGYENLGNTCYLNAVLQVLQGCEPFCHHVRVVEPPFNHTAPLTRALSRLFRRRETDAGSVLHQLTRANQMFSGQRQHDAHEALRIILDIVDTENSVKVPAHFEPSFSPPTANPSSHAPPLTHLSAPSLTRTGSDEKTEKFMPTEPSTPAGYGVVMNLDTSITKEPPTQDAPQGTGPVPTPTPPAVPPTYNQSIVSDTFQGALQSCITCLTCGAQSKTKEHFFDLSVPLLGARPLGCGTPCTAAHSASKFLPVDRSRAVVEEDDEEAQERRGSDSSSTSYSEPGYIRSFFKGIGLWLGLKSVTLEECLSKFFSLEYMRGEERYACDRCKAKKDAEKSLKLAYVPEMLCIHVKRFRGGTYWSQKLYNRVVFPLAGLDMSPYSIKTRASSRTCSCLYDLVGLVQHSGGLSHGHYTAYVLDANTNRWRWFNDNYVQDVTREHVAASSPYLLVYKRRALPIASITREPSITHTSDVPVSMLNTPTPAAISAVHSINNTEAVDKCSTNSECCSASSNNVDVNNIVEPAAIEEKEEEVYVSRAWAVRLLTSSWPGPVNNHSLLCSHGKMRSEIDPADAARGWLIGVPRSKFDAYVEKYRQSASENPDKSDIFSSISITNLGSACVECHELQQTTEEEKQQLVAAV